MGKKHRRKSYDYEFEEEFDDNAVDLNEYDRNDYKGSAEDDGKEDEKEPLETLSPEEKRALALWMDNNCDFFGAYELETMQAQRHGEIVYPTLE